MSLSSSLKGVVLIGFLTGLPLASSAAILSTYASCRYTIPGESPVVSISQSTTYSSCLLTDASINVFSNATAIAAPFSVTANAAAGGPFGSSISSGAYASSTATLLITFTGGTGTGYFLPCVDGDVSFRDGFGSFVTSGPGTCGRYANPTQPQVLAFTFNQPFEATLTLTASMGGSDLPDDCPGCGVADFYGLNIYDSSGNLILNSPARYTIADITAPEPSSLLLFLAASTSILAVCKRMRA